MARFTATAEKGPVSALLDTPDTSEALVVLAHGAGADMHHRHMTALAEALCHHHIAVLRFNFPFMEHGRGRPDAKAVCLETIGHALDFAREQMPDKALFLAGHSFGGRMASHYAAENPDSDIRGLAFFSFPLHPQGKPGVKRAEHLSRVTQPMLFVSGTRDKLADRDLLESVVAGCSMARLHWLDTADHGFGVLKRRRETGRDVYEEAASVLAGWLSDATTPE